MLLNIRLKTGCVRYAIYAVHDIVPCLGGATASERYKGATEMFNGEHSFGFGRYAALESFRSGKNYWFINSN